MRRFGMLVLIVFMTAPPAVTATKPTTIHKSKSSHKKIEFASDLCAVGHAPESGVGYEIEPCHRGIHVAELLSFQVKPSARVAMTVSGAINATACKSCRIDVRIILSVDGSTIGSTEVHLKGCAASGFALTRSTRIAKGRHRVELGISPVREERLSGLSVISSELVASTG